VKPSPRPSISAASKKIDERIAELGGWRGELLARLRELIHAADPEIEEEWKWATPVWSHDGGVCTGEAYKQAVKLTFFRGASLADPKGLFTSSLEGATRRAIDLREGERIKEGAFKALIRAAVAANAEARAAARTRKSKTTGVSVRVVSRVALPIPPDLASALREARVLPAWESLAPGKRSYLLKSIEEAAQQATRTKRIGRAVEEALARHEKNVDRGAR
jgi:hypothetical protein